MSGFGGVDAMVADVIKLNKIKHRRRQGRTAPQHAMTLAYWALNGVFLADATWHCWALATNHSSTTLISKFFLGFTLALLLKQQLRDRLPTTVLIAILFCIAGDILLHPLDLNYTDMSADRPVHFILGVICFCVAYGHLARYFMDLNPEWRSAITAQPWALIFNCMVTLVVLLWMTLHSQAQSYLLAVLWLYSPIVVGAATLATYTYARVRLLPFLALLVGMNLIVISDTIIGLSVFARISLPWLSNSVWILSTYIAGIFLVFNAVIYIENARLENVSGKVAQ